MYFLSDEERSLLAGRLLPDARRHGVHPELRGWSWQQPPLSPIYDERLAIREVAEKSCDSGRDVYLRHVLGLPLVPNRAMREEAALQRALADLVVSAKRVIYEHGPEGCLSRLAELAEEQAAEATSMAEPGARMVELPVGRAVAGARAETTVVERGVVPAERREIDDRVATLRAWECGRIVGRVQDVISREPTVGADALVALALPVTVERVVNGGFLGLASHLSVDAVGTFEGIVFAVRFGERRDFHRLTTTGYAMVLESLYGYSVDVSCIVYVTFDAGRVLVERDLHVVDDELRQWFVEERDEKSRLVSEEIDPGLASECPAACPFWRHCHGS